jgi:hypothetical protein
MKADKDAGGKTQKPTGKKKEAFHCDDLTVDLKTINE